MYGGDFQMGKNNPSSSSRSSNLNISHMNMNMFCSDSGQYFYSLPITNHIYFDNNNANPNFNFTPTTTNNLFMMPTLHNITSQEEIKLDGLKGRKVDEMEQSGSESDQLEQQPLTAANDTTSDHHQSHEQQPQPQPKKKRYHRHTAHQIQQMEAVFKESPHPDDKQRMRLGQELGLKPRQIKFWFQNRRTQMKGQQDRQDNAVLRQENENLMNENCRLQAATRNVACPNCGGPAMLGDVGFDEQQLRIENARLKEELERVCNLMSNFSSSNVQLDDQPSSVLKPSLDLEMSIYPRHFQQQMTMPNNLLSDQNPYFNEGVMIMEHKKQLALELALSSVDELIKLCRIGQPLWYQCNENGKEVLNIQEYGKMFPWATDTGSKCKSNELMIRTEATRETAVVIMNSITLVDAFMDSIKWADLFPSIISSAKTIQVVCSGVPGQANGSLILMNAELQYLSPLVPTRELYFLRYCQQNPEERTWVIVDFPIYNFQNHFHSSHLPVYKRKPSGCIIQDMPNGYSRVTWVEHSEIEDKPIHQIFSNIVNNGTAFGAERWLNVLQRQCEHLASLMARNIPDLGVIPSPEARKNLMKLAHRMIKTFCVNISASNGQLWTALSDSSDDTIRITTRKVTETGQPNGVILTAASTTWLPYSHYQVFDLLRDEHKRSQLDVISNGNSLHEVAHIANGSHPGNCISLLRSNVASNSSQNVELILQESCIDKSGCLIVYSNVAVDSIQLAMSAGDDDTSSIPLLPIGFVITPAAPPNSANEDLNHKTGGSGCLLTIGLQVLASSLPSAKLSLSSITAINNHISDMVHQIGIALRTTSNGIEEPALASSAGGSSTEAKLTSKSRSQCV